MFLFVVDGLSKLMQKEI
jgi:hypothetical protein